MSQCSSFTELVEKVRRKSLEDLPPAIPADSPIHGFTAQETAPSMQIKPKKPLCERYDTYITCPGCGSLVPKGTTRCDCGYDLSGPVTRLGRRLLCMIPAFVSVILILVSCVFGYYAGQKSMISKLEAQYEAGEAAGYREGYQKGLHEGLSEGSKSQSNAQTLMPQVGSGKLIPIE